MVVTEVLVCLWSTSSFIIITFIKSFSLHPGQSEDLVLCYISSCQYFYSISTPILDWVSSAPSANCDGQVLPTYGLQTKPVLPFDWLVFLLARLTLRLLLTTQIKGSTNNLGSTNTLAKLLVLCFQAVGPALLLVYVVFVLPRFN